VGKVIKINGKSFRVSGVLPDKGQVLFFDVGELVIVPYTTARAYLAGTPYYNEVWVQVSDVSRVNETVRDIELTMRELHNITNPDKDDFYIMTQESLLNQVSSIIDILTVAVAAIAAIALVVGGVGIMNIMLVSVTERTREIGLRKAIGATGGDILKQFMIEAMMLTGAGGVLGALFGMLIAYLLSVGLSTQLGVAWGTGIKLANIGLGVGVSVAVGLVFGVVPALRASQKQPIEALRYE
jgi:putative ABC transport system permease protein